MALIIEGNNWEDYQIGPDFIERPKKGETKGYYLIKADNIEDIWDKIKRATSDGLFGHYSAVSPKRNLIVVHFKYHEKEKTDRHILNDLVDLGVHRQRIEFRMRTEENHLTNAVITSDTFEKCRRVRTSSGQTVTKDMYEKSPQEFDGLRYVSNE